MKNFTVNQMCRMNGMLIGSSSLGNDTAKRRQRDGIERQGHSSVGITKLLFAITLLLTLGVGQMWADNTRVVGVAATNASNGAVIVKANIGDNNTWWNYTITSNKAGITFEGKKLYIGTMNEKYGGVDALKISVNGSDKQPYSGWTNSSTFQNRIFNYDASGSPKYSDVSMTNGARVYFDATGWSQTAIKLVTGHANHQKYYTLSAITNTKLYYGTNTDTWSDAMGCGIVGGTSRSGANDQWLTDVSANAKEYTGWKNYGLTATGTNQAYLIVPAGKGGEEPTINYYGTAYSSLNSTQTVRYALSTNGGTPTQMSSGTTPGKITMSSYKFVSGTYNSVSSESPTALSAGGTTYYRTFTAARTATTTLTVSNVVTGYEFVGWYTAANGGTELSTSTSYTYYPTAATTVYARFRENTYTVSFANDGHGSTSPSSDQTVGQLTGIAVSTSNNTGYHFSTWSITSGSGSFTSAATTSSNTFKPTSNATITASFAANNYTVTLDKNGGDSDGSITTTYDSSSTDDLDEAGYAGHSCTGYYDDPDDGEGNLIINADGTIPSSTVSGWLSSGTWVKDGADITLYAHWEEDLTLYDVTFGVGTSYTSLGSLSAEVTSSGEDITSGDDLAAGTGITFTASPNTGYQVDGFYSDASCETELQSGTTTTYTIASLGADVTVYVKFIPITYNITYYLDGGTNHGSNPATYNITTPTITLQNPNKTGYTFVGWYTNAEKTISGNTITVGSTGNKTFWAKWTENMTAVTISASPAGTGTFTVNSVAGSSASAGVTTTKSIVAVPHADYTWTSWTATNCSVSPTNNKSTTLSGDGSSSTGTLVGTFTLVPCSLMYGGSTPLNSPTSAVMSYDLETGAYYKDVTTNSSPYYFRFSHNDGKQYSGNWTSYPDVNAVTANGSKVTCNTETEGWDNKASLKYVGESGTQIRIWFDYQNKKAWITASEDKHYVLRGSQDGDGDPNSGMPGWGATTSYFNGLASGNTGTITATLNAATAYKFKVYDMYNSAWKGKNGEGTQAVMDGTLYTLGTGGNFTFTSTIAGTYTFTVDKSSGLKVKVDYPVSYQLNYDIGTVKGTSGSISTDPSTASGSYVPSGNSVELTAPDAKTGYTWSGWFTNEAGTEGQIADDNRVITVTMNANKTLYACYTENEYNATVSAGSNGSVSPSETVAIKQVNGTSLTATPNMGYHFDHWAISGGGITPTSSTTSPQTFKATETGGTIQAIFAENTYTVNVNSGNPDFGSVSTTSVSGIGIATYSDEITATPETGATFTGWTLPSGVTAAAGYTSSSNPIKINATASGKAITANFSETKYTATITTEDDDYGTVSPTSASVGQITAVQITASKKTGYMFAGWKQTAGSGTVTYHVAAGAGSSVDATGNTQSITYITIDGNVTLQATWEEDRSAGWFLRGTWTDGWSKTGQKEFIKNVGETAGTVSYVRWTLAPEMFTDATMQMKMYDGSTYYGHSTDFDAAGNLCTKDNNNSNITFYSGVAYQNFKVSIPVAGEYIFRWDSSTKQLTITYPAGNFIRGTFDSWSWDHVLEPTGNANEYSCVISMTGDKAPHAWTGSDGFKVVLAGDHYGKNSTGVTRASRSVSSLQSDGANINWTTDVRGDYTFTVNSSSKTVTVTYPDAYTVTYGYGAGGSSVSASATSVGGSFSSGAYVAAGDDITFTQTAVDGNTFNGWYNATSGGDAIACMASDNVYDDLAGNINVYAQYIPTTYTNVTLNATTGSTNGAYSVTFGGTTITVTTPPVKTGYEPEGFYESYADGVWTNKIATSAGALQNNTTYTDATGHWTSTASPTLYTKWQPKTYTITLHDNNGESHNGSVTATYDSNTLTSLTVPTRTGYHIVDGYYKEPVLTNKIINADGTLCASTAYTDASGNWTNDGAVTLYAKWEPDVYTITFDPNSGTVDPTSASVTFDAAISNAPVPTRTGYTFTGYNTAGGASITTNTGVFKASVDGFTDGSAHWVNADDATITAQWSANEYTITLTQSGETGYGSAGTASVTATYDAALPTIASLPTAANGYAFMGYFTDHDGAGTKYYDADGTKMVASYTTADGVELFAYFKKAEITLAFDDAVVLPEGTVGVTPTISPTPEGTTIICWTILHGDDTPLAPQPALTWSEGKLTFTASQYSGTYKVQAVLRTGSSCEGGDELDTETSSFMVAGTHNVTVNYKCGDDVIKASTIMENVEPLNWTDEFTAPDIFGYTFSRWDAADGVTIKNGDSDPVTTSTNATIQIKATYNGNLTAVYTQKSMIYFKNTLGWSNVYVNFYTDSYWNNPKGSGNQSVTKRNLAMTRYGETDIWYYDYGAASITPSLYVSFTSESQDNTEFFWKAGGVNVVYPANYPDAINTDKSSETGFKAATPMFVPLATQDKVTLNQSSGGKADYYNAGYWTMFTPGTGYTLEIYNNSNGNFIKSQAFTSADDLMPMKATLDLEGGTTYKFQIRRGGTGDYGVYYGNSGTMTYADHGQGTPWDMTNGPLTMCRITTNAAGDYTFNLSYSGNSSTPPHYRLRIAVDYPVASGDYRLVYKDDVHTKIHPSAIVNKVNDGTDIVSFFVRHDQNPKLYIQQATVNPSTGAVTWNEYPTSGTQTNQITGDIASAITAGGTEVYNFNLSMNGSGAMTVASAEIYEGNFYIRTDAANSKWDNYRTDPDHLMTYSEYSITHGGYTHYYTHWVDKDETGRKNVKFTIANDYSPCISDTLAREEATGTWANIASFMESGGDLKRSANVRFMWDKRDNSISRAYIDGAQGDYSSNFLYMLNVEAGADKIKKEDGTALTDHKVTFKDNGNWMYEANIKVQPEAQIRLLSNWGTENTITQYFRGADDDTETLLGGSGDTWYDIRIIYDFKTNRLIAGLIPSGTIDEQMAIHADVMFVREHHGDIAQLTFAEKDDKMGAITDIETAFGVIQFNKWTLNNKDKSTHSPLPNPQPSRFERDIFYVSFPFRVNLEEVFGFGTYGTHWIIEEYDGAARAEKGFWADTETFWRFIKNRKGKFLEPNTGYILALDLDELGESSSVWANTDQVELYFPSYGPMPTITSSSVTYNVPAHTCNIGPRFAGGDDRRIKDSHWNVISVPTYINTDDVTFASTDWITAGDGQLGPNFLYTWNKSDNTLSATSGVGYTYHAMHAYMVQYCGDVTWTTSVSPAPAVGGAPRRNPNAPKDAEYRLELSQNDKMVDQTFVRLSNDEHVTTGFEFNYDLSKEFNKNKANIYTMVSTMIDGDLSITETAGNTLPMTEQTTVVPVGVKIATTGDYTFAIPEGTNGVGVTLIDNETGIRTSLSALDYTVNLNAGTYNERFVLEISPVNSTPTGIENGEWQNGDGARKVLIDNHVYIIRGDKMYDATGALVDGK